MPNLPNELIEYIVELSASHHVAYALRDVISDYIVKKFASKSLLYGEVQGGKTRAVIDILRKTNGLRVLVVQNSLLVLKQYIKRLQDAKLNAQVIDKNTKNIDSDIVIVLANCYRYSYFSRVVDHNNFTLFLDEADQTFPNCPLQGKATFFVTATPRTLEYDNKIILKSDSNYYGLDKVNFKVVSEEHEAVQKFLSGPSGMMLVNSIYAIADMQKFAKETSRTYPEIPVVMLSSERILYLRGAPKLLNRNKTISRIIDSLADYPHVIFVAHRMSNRGLSYTSSDYSRHLTCQYTRARNFTSFYQSLRLLGIYKDDPTLTLYVNSDKQVARIERWKIRIQEERK
jgi:hypothetical protein